VRRHPLFRALRVDKLTIAAMGATLGAYLRAAWDEIPAQRMIRASLQEISERTAKFVEALRLRVDLHDTQLDIIEGHSLVGGGSTPAQSLPTKLLRITSRRYSAVQLEACLRSGPAGIPVVTRIEDDCLLLDLRTVFAEQEPALGEALVAALH
jgi:L-seryl-tRNA(Ser) seleniumtransferase